MKTCLAILCILLCSGHVRAACLTGEPAPAFSLSDQYDRSYSLKYDSGHIVVLVASDRRGSGQCHAWGAALGNRYGSLISMIGAANVSQAPSFLRNIIKAGFRQEKIRVLMDWDGALFTACRFARRTANIVVIDRSGLVRHNRSGDFDASGAEELFKLIDELLQKEKAGSAPQQNRQ